MLLKLLTITLHLLIVCNFSSTEFSPRINCSHIVAVNCECSFLHEFESGSIRSFVELECIEGNDFRKQVFIKNEKNEVSVTCHSIGSANFYHLIPALNIDIISDVTLNCPLNTQATIKSITDRIGINRFNRLSITIDELIDDLFDDDLNIKRLDVILAQDGLAFFPTDFLKCLSNLEFFHFKSLDGQGSTFIESSIFHHQNKLKSIQLADVVIKTLGKELLDGASSVINLEFHHSTIEVITVDAFERLTELMTLKFHFTRITTLPDTVLRKTHQLKDFYLASNAIISADLMSNLTSLETVELSACSSPLPPNTFTGSTNIKVISLTQIHMITIPSEIFHDQTELVELDLSSNSMLALPDTIFETNKKLNKINLGYNLLQTIPAILFASTEKLTELNLECNKIQQISNDILPGSLTLLQLNGNRLRTIDDRLLNRLSGHDGKLKYLNIQSNEFECDCGTNFHRSIEFYSEKLNINRVLCQKGNQSRTMKSFIESCAHS